jgi:hypothetical protein
MSTRSDYTIEAPDSDWIGSGGAQDMVADSAVLGGIREIPPDAGRG